MRPAPHPVIGWPEHVRRKSALNWMHLSVPPVDNDKSTSGICAGQAEIAGILHCEEGSKYNRRPSTALRCVRVPTF